MSQAVQRVVVRMLHDPDFARAVCGGAPVPDLSPAEQSLLHGQDPRAFTTDPYRRSRLLTALLDEFMVAAALATDGGRQLRDLDRFFSSPDFHRSIQDRGVLALSFGAWLSPQVPGIGALELGLAQARRDTVRAPGDTHLQRAAGAVPLSLPTGTLDRWQALRGRLGSDPLTRMTRDPVSLDGLPPLSAGREYWLVEVDAQGNVGLGGGSDGLHALLVAAGRPISRAALVQVAHDAGAGDDAADIVDGLVEEGLLVRVA